MKNSLLILLLASFLCRQSNAQTPVNQLEFRKTFWSTGFYQGNDKLSNARLKEIMTVNPAALAELKKARTNQAFSTLFAGVGGALIGIPLGTLAGGGDPVWSLAAIGGGLVIIAIPFETGFTRKARNAINMYNSGAGKTSGLNPQLRVGFTSNGMGISVSF